MDKPFESIASFAKRVNLPTALIRALVKQGQIPYVPTGKSHKRIHTEAGMEAVKKYAEQSAQEIAATMPVPMRTTYPRPIPRSERKRQGRPTDAARLGKAQCK